MDPFTLAEITEITSLEYDSLKEAIANNEEIDIGDGDDEEPIPEVIDDEPNITLEYVREAKLKEMSTACKHTIEAGFDLVIRGDTHHFSLTTQD